MENSLGESKRAEKNREKNRKTEKRGKKRKKEREEEKGIESWGELNVKDLRFRSWKVEEIVACRQACYSFSPPTVLPSFPITLMIFSLQLLFVQ